MATVNAIPLALRQLAREWRSGELGILLVTATIISFALPMLAIWLIRVFRLRSA